MANVVSRFEKSSCDAIPFSIDNIARPTSLCCVIFARKHVLISLSFENERSPQATVTGTVSKIRNATETFGTRNAPGNLALVSARTPLLSIDAQLPPAGGQSLPWHTWLLASSMVNKSRSH